MNIYPVEVLDQIDNLTDLDSACAHLYVNLVA